MMSSFSSKLMTAGNLVAKEIRPPDKPQRDNQQAFEEIKRGAISAHAAARPAHPEGDAPMPTASNHAGAGEYLCSCTRNPHAHYPDAITMKGRVLGVSSGSEVTLPKSISIISQKDYSAANTYISLQT